MSLFFNIAIVGRPNVGKSRLFNRLAKERISIVHDMAGVTRDVITHEIDRRVILMDTGGLGLSGANSVQEITAAVDDQVLLAIQSADLILFVVDATEGIMPMDYDIAELLRKSRVPVKVIANKVDRPEKEALASVFKKFGFGEPIVASAEHGRGEEDIRLVIKEATRDFLQNLEKEEEEEERAPIRFAFIGRPNVGKSSLVNALLQEQRMIVSPVPGTTREAVRLKLPPSEQSRTGRNLELMDTAGARPQSRITTSLDYFSNLRTRDGIIRCDVIFLVIEAEEGVTHLDRKLIGEVIEAGKGVILVINKWDMAQKAIKEERVEGYHDIRSFQEAFEKAAQDELRAFPGIEMIFTSTKSSYGLKYLLPMAEKLYLKMQKKLGTGELNRVIHQAFEARQPSTASGRRFKIYYAVQTGNMPFQFKVFCNRRALLSENYKKYLLNSLRNHFDFAGCTIKLDFVEKDRRYSKEEAED